MGQWTFEKFWHSFLHLYATLALLRSSVQNSLDSHTVWHKDCCMSKRLELGSDMVLEEAVTAARHSKSISLPGLDILVGIHMLHVQPKKVTSCRWSRKSQHICTCHCGDTHTLSADRKSDNLLPEICFGGGSWSLSWPGATSFFNRSHCTHWRDPRSSIPIFSMEQLDFLPLCL